MSGTSMDGADAVLAAFGKDAVKVIEHHHLAYPDALRRALFALQADRPNQLDDAQLAALGLAEHYAKVIACLLGKSALAPRAIRAVAVHGQTIRHRPEKGYTVQLNAPAHLAERCQIDVICDFRSRDVAAGGHGAPLVPAFHAALFGDATEHRVAVNLGGMANITDLPPGVAVNEHALRGWDTGPGNVFLDHWFETHATNGATFDADGALARSGAVSQELLKSLLSDPWFALPPPKSTGRDHFNEAWLATRLGSQTRHKMEDVQATLAQFTAQTIADSMAQHIPHVQRLILCGGGANNSDLLLRLQTTLASHLGREVVLETSQTKGIAVEHVEAAAFAWLGKRFLEGQPGNRPSVTGARGLRILGALYPA